jgi:hypothetical protein
MMQQLVVTWATVIVHAAATSAAAAAALPPAVQEAVQHIVERRDHGASPFIVIDKVQAHLWLFNGQGKPSSDTPVLLGAARGDHSVPGIGERPLSQIRAHERTTPAGRFVAEPGLNHQGEDIIWVDYEAAVSIHRVRATHPRERRLERLSTPTPVDNRISYGCINVPVAFYERWLVPLIRQHRPIVYVLPETRAAATGLAAR